MSSNAAAGQPDWPALVFDMDFTGAVDKLAARRFGSGVLAEEAATYVLEYLAADDWASCRRFKGNAKPKTFLVTLASNAIEEFSRKRFGRMRPPTWLQELGELWVKLWRSICLERQPLPAIVDRFCQRGFREEAAVAQAAKVIKARIPTCGHSSRDAADVEDIDAVSDAVQAEQDCDCDSETPEFDNPFHAELVMMLRAVVDPEVDNSSFSGDEPAACDRVAAAQGGKLTLLKEALSLSDSEKIMLRMIFVEGLSKTATSKALGMPAHQAGRAVNEVLQRIGAALRDCGLELEDLLGEQ